MMLSQIQILILVCTLNAGEEKKAAYSKVELLIEPADLTKVVSAATHRILDVRPKEKYEAGHIPEAVWVDHDQWAKAYGHDDKPGWEHRIGALGFISTATVVIYDDVRNNRAARIWWILRDAGVRDVRLLNGGWKGWQDAGGEVTKKVPDVGQTKIAIEFQKDRLADKKFVLDAVKTGIGQIIDVRSKEEYVGEDKRAKQGGAIPGAKHLEWSDAMDAKTQRFKYADELKMLFAAAGIDPGKPCTTYCQSGGRAAVMAFTLELMGGKDVRNYYRSWAEWGNADDTPIETPKK
jgi:thiosulfate/3-mercaptopyruvate sulfurtransferase